MRVACCGILSPRRVSGITSFYIAGGTCKGPKLVSFAELSSFRRFELQRTRFRVTSSSYPSPCVTNARAYSNNANHQLYVHVHNLTEKFYSTYIALMLLAIYRTYRPTLNPSLSQTMRAERKLECLLKRAKDDATFSFDAQPSN